MKNVKILEIKDLQKYEAHLSQKAMVWLQIAKAISQKAMVWLQIAKAIKSSVNIFVGLLAQKISVIRYSLMHNLGS